MQGLANDRYPWLMSDLGRGLWQIQQTGEFNCEQGVEGW